MAQTAFFKAILKFCTTNKIFDIRQLSSKTEFLQKVLQFYYIEQKVLQFYGQGSQSSSEVKEAGTAARNS